MTMLEKLQINNEQKVFYRRVMMLTIPIIVQNLIASLLNLMDTVMIGRLGELYLASVGIANQYFFFFTLMLFGVNAGCSIFISQFWGKKDEVSIKKTAALAISFSFVIGILFMLAGIYFSDEIISVFNSDKSVLATGGDYLKIVAFSYIFTAITVGFAFSLRSTENTFVPMVGSIAALLVNVVLNYILIFGKLGFPAMGVKGAAIATVIARIIETMIILIYVYKKSNLLNINFSHIKMLDFKFIKIVYAGMLPVLINEFVWGLGNLTYNIIYARMGGGTAAAIQVTSTVMNLLMIVIIGLGNSAMVIVGKEIGAKREDLGKLYAKRLYKFALIIAIIIATVIFLTANDFVYFFKMSATVLNDTKRILYVNAILLLIRSYTFIMIVGVLRGAGDSKYAVKIQGLTLWTIGIPMAFIGAFILNLEVYYVVALTGMEEIVKYIFIRRRFKSGKWIHNMTN